MNTTPRSTGDSAILVLVNLEVTTLGSGRKEAVSGGTITQVMDSMGATGGFSRDPTRDMDASDIRYRMVRRETAVDTTVDKASGI